MPNEEVPDAIRKALEEALGSTGLTIIDVEAQGLCGFDINGPDSKLYAVIRSNLLRALFLGGPMNNAAQHVMSANFTGDITEIMRNAPMSYDEYVDLAHTSKHVVSDIMERFLRDAIEPWISALYDQGLYVPHANQECDFACMADKPRPF